MKIDKSIFSKINLENSFVESLPSDTLTTNERREVLSSSYSFVNPAPSSSPELVAFSREVAQDIGLDEEDANTSDFLEVMSGNKTLPEFKPYAMCYGGHQFGHWAGQLGDGRVINLIEVKNQDQRFTLQLKGAGLTPYSRTADGLAVLRSSLREFLCSEAMHHLGVPTTRALSLSVTGDQVLRDMFYDGNAKHEAGAVVCRVAPSFIRFGNFQIHAARGEVAILRQLANYTISHFFPELLTNKSEEPDKEIYLKWFKEICSRTVELIVHWMRVGFVHGVMNTDNMSIHGLTIDYGPYGWVDNFDMNWTPNTTDAQGRRYRFGAQAEIAHWNLYQLANALFPLIDNKEALLEILHQFPKDFETQRRQMMASKLGLQRFDEEAALFENLEKILQSVETDMTMFYRLLPDVDLSKATGEGNGKANDSELIEPLMPCYYQPQQLTDEKRLEIVNWLRQYGKRVQIDGEDNVARRNKMNAANPKYVLRNYIAQLAIDEAEKGDYGLVSELMEMLRQPYDEQDQYQKYFCKRPDWARERAGCSMLSCSS